MPNLLRTIQSHLEDVKACHACPRMIGPVVTPTPVVSKVYMCGQAPGPREGELGRPFAWTAGKTLFRWFEGIGLDEAAVRSRAYMAAVCRCFPGKAAGGGDRVPDAVEIEACERWMKREVTLLRPELVIPIGRVAIERFLPPRPLAEVIGRKHRVSAYGVEVDLIPLPHPSGASTWFKMSPGKELTEKALGLIARHPAWKALRRE